MKEVLTFSPVELLSDPENTMDRLPLGVGVGTGLSEGVWTCSGVGAVLT